MLQILYSVFLIFIGAFLIFGEALLPKGEGVEDKPMPSDDKRTDELKNLQAPSNFPKILRLFFGSQSGTAEKFCQIL